MEKVLIIDTASLCCSVCFVIITKHTEQHKQGFLFLTLGI